MVKEIMTNINRILNNAKKHTNRRYKKDTIKTNREEIKWLHRRIEKLKNTNNVDQQIIRKIKVFQAEDPKSIRTFNKRLSQKKQRKPWKKITYTKRMNLI